MRHVKALSYKPKIPGCLKGEIERTIRGGRGVDVNDVILFHGWGGIAYRSSWSWRMEVFVVDTVNIEVFDAGICFGYGADLLMWACPKVDELAIMDGIEPECHVERMHPGLALKRVLAAMLKENRKGPRHLSDKPIEMQQIVWDHATRKILATDAELAALGLTRMDVADAGVLSP